MLDDSAGNAIARYLPIVDLAGDTVPYINSITYGPNDALVAVGQFRYSVGGPFAFLLDTINNIKIARKFYAPNHLVNFDKIFNCDSGYLVTGYYSDSLNGYHLILKLDGNLNILWNVLCLNTTQAFYTKIWDVAVDSNSNIVLSFRSNQHTGMIARIDSAGNNVQAWTVDSALLSAVCAWNDGFAVASMNDTLNPLIAKYDWNLTSFNCALTPLPITVSTGTIMDSTFNFTLTPKYHFSQTPVAISWPDMPLTEHLLCGNTPAAINENNYDASSIEIYPNPTFDNCKVLLNNNSGDLKISVRNIYGQIICLDKKIKNGDAVSLVNQPKGVYYFYVDAGNLHMVRKAVKM